MSSGQEGGYPDSRREDPNDFIDAILSDGPDTQSGAPFARPEARPDTQGAPVTDDVPPPPNLNAGETFQRPVPPQHTSQVERSASSDRRRGYYIDGESGVTWLRAPEPDTDLGILARRLAQPEETRPAHGGTELSMTDELIQRAVEEERAQVQWLHETSGRYSHKTTEIDREEREFLLHKAGPNCVNPLEHEILERDGAEKHPYLSRLNQLFYDDFIQLLENAAGVSPAYAKGTVQTILEQHGEPLSPEELDKNYEAIRRTNPDVRSAYISVLLVPKLFQEIKNEENSNYQQELKAWADETDRQLDEFSAAEEEREQRLSRRLVRSLVAKPASNDAEHEQFHNIRTKNERNVEIVDLKITAADEVSKRAMERLEEHLLAIREKVLEGIYISQDEGDVIQATAWYLGIKEHEGRHKNRTKERDPDDPTKVLETEGDDVVAQDKFLSLVGRTSDVDPATDPVRVYQDNMLMKRTLGKFGLTDDSIMWIGHFTQRPGGRPFPGAILAENRLGGHELAVGDKPGTIEIQATLRWVTERAMKILLGELYSDPDAERVIAQEWNDPTIFMAETLNVATRDYILPHMEGRSEHNDQIYEEIARLRSRLITDKNVQGVLRQPAIGAGDAATHALPVANAAAEGQQEPIVEAEVVEETPATPEGGAPAWAQAAETRRRPI